MDSTFGVCHLAHSWNQHHWREVCRKPVPVCCLLPEFPAKSPTDFCYPALFSWLFSGFPAHTLLPHRHFYFGHFCRPYNQEYNLTIRNGFVQPTFHECHNGRGALPTRQVLSFRSRLQTFRCAMTNFLVLLKFRTSLWLSQCWRHSLQYLRSRSHWRLVMSILHSMHTPS